MKILKLSVLKNKKNIVNHYTLFNLKFFQLQSIRRQIIGNLLRRSLIKTTI